MQPFAVTRFHQNERKLTGSTKSGQIWNKLIVIVFCLVAGKAIT